MGIGDYPAEYNPKIHGPYDPARYYGKPDTPFGQVKLGELGLWLKRRNKTPNAVIAAVSRAHWRWMHKYVHPKRTGLTPLLQICAASVVFFYAINYKRMKVQRQYEYH